MLITGGARAGEIERIALEDLTAAERFKRFRNNRFPLNIDKTQEYGLTRNAGSCQHHSGQTFGFPHRQEAELSASH